MRIECPTWLTTDCALGALRRVDWILIGLAAFLVVVGMAAIWSASYDPGTHQHLAHAWKQGIRLAISAAAFAAALIPPYRWFHRHAFLLFGLSLLLLVLVLAFGKTVNHSQGWFALGPIRMQPSEFVKLSLILALARYLTYRNNDSSLFRLLAPFVLTCLPALLLVKQPDLGTAVLLFPVLLAMIFAAGARIRHLSLVMALGLLSMPVFYHYALRPYQQRRILGFLDPEASSLTDGYQLLQSIIAIGSGEMGGKGWGRGTQNYLHFIPERHTDFIFSVIGEEGGWIGSLLVLAAFLALLSRMLWIAYRTKEPFGRLLVVGVGTLFLVQSYVNVGMTVGLVPITGVTLPFISYGGSSLLTSFLGLGLVMNVAIRRVPVFSREEFHRDHGEYAFDEEKLIEIRRARRYDGIAGGTEHSADIPGPFAGRRSSPP